MGVDRRREEMCLEEIVERSAYSGFVGVSYVERLVGSLKCEHKAFDGIQYGKWGCNWYGIFRNAELSR